MIFFKGTMYAKVWKVSPEAKYIDLRVSTSEKKDDGTFASSTWFPRVIGQNLHNKSKVHQRKLYEKGHRRNKVSIQVPHS